MEQYLRCYVSYQQVDWADWLPMAELAANNQVVATTNPTALYANYGYHPCMVYGHQTHATTPQTMDGKEFVNIMRHLQVHLQTQMNVAQDRYEESTNKH